MNTQLQLLNILAQRRNAGVMSETIGVAGAKHIQINRIIVVNVHLFLWEKNTRCAVLRDSKMV